MKNYFFIGLIFLIFSTSCNAPQANKVASPAQDLRPKEQVEFLQTLAAADKKYRSHPGEIEQLEGLDSGKAKVKHFVVERLKTEIKFWHAYVKQVKVIPWPIKGIEAILVIPNERVSEMENLEYKGAVLRSYNLFSETKIKDALKTLKKDDKVLVSGKFIVLENGVLDFRHFGVKTTIFQNPEFGFFIDEIKKM